MESKFRVGLKSRPTLENESFAFSGTLRCAYDALRLVTTRSVPGDDQLRDSRVSITLVWFCADALSLRNKRKQRLNVANLLKLIVISIVYAYARTVCLVLSPRSPTFCKVALLDFLVSNKALLVTIVERQCQ